MLLANTQWTLYDQNYQKWPKRVHWLHQIFSHLAVNQTKIKISFWYFQHLFITSLRKFFEKILAITQTACQLRPILAKTLDASSDRICWDILKRKKLVRPKWVTWWKEFSISFEKWHLETFGQAKASFLAVFPTG